MKTTKKNFRAIIFLYILALITSKIAVFVITLLEFILINYITFGFELKSITILLLFHFVCYILFFKNIHTKKILPERIKILDLLSKIK